MIVRAFLTVLLVLTAAPTFAELPQDVKQLSGALAKLATEASLKIDSETNAAQIKSIFVDGLKSFAQTNKLLALTQVQTWVDKEQIAIDFATINSKPIIMIHVAARDGKLLIERAVCGDETLVDYDWRETAKQPAK
jgi:hypothetical protein